MPTRPGRVCNKAGCPNLVYGSSGYCEQHKVEKHRKYDNRESSAKRGYGYKWQKARKTFLTQNPLCVICQKHGVIRAATVVDHKTAHKGNNELFWDAANWQPLCKECHDRKTATQDGGFGN